MLRVRPLRDDDQALLWEFLYIALWDPPPAKRRPRVVLDLPNVRIYAKEWGRHGDLGVIGELTEGGEPVGACWMRLIPDQRGLAYVDDDTPQLGIALFPVHQRKGYGTTLMHAAFELARAAGVRQISLTVHPENPAIALYERVGFRKVDIRDRYRLMIASL